MITAARLRMLIVQIVRRICVMGIVPQQARTMRCEMLIMRRAGATGCLPCSDVAADFLAACRLISMATACMWRLSAPRDRRAQMRASQYASSPNSFTSSVASRTASSRRAQRRHHQRHPSGRLDRPSLDETSFPTLLTRTDIGHMRNAFDERVSTDRAASTLRQAPCLVNRGPRVVPCGACGTDGQHNEKAPGARGLHS